MKIYLISGKSGSGKDTFANYSKNFLEKQGKKVLIIHFADLVKYYSKQYYNWNGEKDEAGRTLLQQLGTDKMRSINPNYWARTVSEFIYMSDHFNDFDYAFIPDARFINEIEVVKWVNPDALSVRINRFNSDGTAYKNPLLTEKQSNHPSEVELDCYGGFDYILGHSSSEELLKQAQDMFGKVE